jgi:L-ascorbate metabolism protein UlaG (beta-lactamase superfamily)
MAGLAAWLRAGALVGVGALAVSVARAGHILLPALGGAPDKTLMSRSPQFTDGMFRNREASRWVPDGDAYATMREFLRRDERRRPAGRVPLVPAEAPTTSGLHITWYGHASTLVEADGLRVLCDPVWSERVSPLSFVGPKRMHAAPHSLRELPRVHAILISHDHYDHLDMATVQTLARTQSAPFVVPLGVGAHLRHWGIPASRVVELDWHEHVDVGGLVLTATPAQHFSGRGLSRNATLWASWVIEGAGRRVFYSADTGYFSEFTDIGLRYGPFDASLIQIGAYNTSWPDIHMTPEEGVATHIDVRGGLLIPVHWGTFNLAMHPWAEPPGRVWREAKAHEIDLAIPRPGQRVDVDDPPPVDGWWQTLD